MQTRVAKFNIQHDSDALRPDLAISNICRFLMLHDRNVFILPCGALFLSKEVGSPISTFQIDLSVETNVVFFARFDGMVTFDDDSFFTSSKTYSIGGVEAVIFGEDGDYCMFINAFERLCIKKTPCNPEENIFRPYFMVT